MRDFEIILGLLLVAALVQPVARRFDVPVAIAQVLGGLVLSAIPVVASVQVNPELAFTIFVPPLLFFAAATGSLRDVRRNSVLFEQQSLREKADFQVLGAVSQTIGAEEGAVRSAAIEIARSIVSLTIDRF